MTIKNKEDARAIQSAIIKLNGHESANTMEFVKELKADLRKYYHRPVNNENVIATDDSSYTVLEPVPAYVAEEELEGWFDAERRLVYIPSQYDCTGQHFTTGHHFTTFRGRTHLVHNVSVDW